jgi:hypothetical protein
MAYPGDNMDYGDPVARGHSQTVTMASNTATVPYPTPVVILVGEGANNDQLDTLTVSGVTAGDIITLVSDGSDTITVDDANIDLAAATRAIAPGGCLVLRYDGTGWLEVAFTAATDNA